MRQVTKTFNVYTFEDVKQNPELLQTVLEKHADFNVDHAWWIPVYEDAQIVGVTIEGFDGLFNLDSIDVEDLEHTANTIIANWGDTCNGATQAKNFLASDKSQVHIDKFEDDLTLVFKYLLSEHYDYLISEEGIIEALESNEYEFLEDGSIYTEN